MSSFRERAPDALGAETLPRPRPSGASYNTEPDGHRARSRHVLRARHALRRRRPRGSRALPPGHLRAHAHRTTAASSTTRACCSRRSRRASTRSPAPPGTTTSGRSASRPSGTGCSASTPPGGRSRRSSPGPTRAARPTPRCCAAPSTTRPCTRAPAAICTARTGRPSSGGWRASGRPTSSGSPRWGSIGEHLELALFGETATSVSMASGTGLLDQETLRLGRRGAGRRRYRAGSTSSRSPKPDGRRGLRAPWSGRWPSLRGVPWFPAVGDGAASNVGSDCLDPVTDRAQRGDLGRHATGDRRSRDGAARGLWRYRVDRRRALVGGATSEGGNVYAWCRDVLQLPPADEVERVLAERAPDSHGLTLLPFLAGERAPGWRGDRRAAITGLSLSTTALDIAPRRDGGGGAAPDADLRAAGAAGHPRPPAGRFRGRRRPLARVDAHAGGRPRPPDPLVAGE